MSGVVGWCGAALFAETFVDWSATYVRLNAPPDWVVLLAIPGHMAWLLWFGNIVHSTGLHHKLIKVFAYSVLSLIAGGAAAGAVWWLLRLADGAEPLPYGLQVYVWLCAANSLCGALPWLIRRLRRREPAALLADRAQMHDLRGVFGGGPTGTRHGQRITALPGNESLRVVVHEKEVRLSRLPAELDGLRIAHLSDWHLTGRIGKPYFDRVVELVNATEPDLVLFTGDLVEKPECWDWIPDVFGKLRHRHGAYYIFGNHDIRIDERETRRRLQAAGLVDVGGGNRRIDVRGVEVMLAGNERPWIRQAADPATFPPRSAALPSLRVLLSHSPDQYPWAKRHDFDLMLAGHVHGGQIQIPPVGAILAPSRFGVHYSCGTFHEPPTVMHVSRGLSSKLPLRYFCPPEVTTLVLRR